MKYKISNILLIKKVSDGRASNGALRCLLKIEICCVGISDLY